MRPGGTDDEAAAYVEATGHRPDPVAIDLFRLMWDLADLVAYVDVLRGAHGDNDDTRMAYNGLARTLAAGGEWADQLG
jgi:spectinomycin phosphotransferase